MGVLTGIASDSGQARSLTHQLYGVQSDDPITLRWRTATLCGVALSRRFSALRATEAYPMVGVAPRIIRCT